jgi:hypothetical protein
MITIFFFTVQVLPPMIMVYFRAKIIPEIGTDGREPGKYQRLRH